MIFKSRFIKNYEKYVYEARKEYYENITIYNRGYSLKNIIMFLPYIVAIIGVFFLYINGGSFRGFIISIVVVFVLNVAAFLLEKLFDVSDLSKYEMAIRRLGYFSIDSYERRLKLYVTGKFGYYTKLLNDFKVKYQLDDHSKTIMDINGNSFYIFTDAKMDKIILLSNNTNIKPKLNIINYGSIRYYRVDQFKQMVILKTNNDEYYFKMNALPVFSELLKEKNFANLNTFNPEDYISDFQLYMHRVKRKLDDQRNVGKKASMTSLVQIITIFVLVILSYPLEAQLDSYSGIILLLRFVGIFFISIFMNILVHYFKGIFSNEGDYIKIINSDPKNIERFMELKNALGIQNDYDIIYSMAGAPYLTWYRNGYFHLFLDMIYFDVVYMVINPKTIEYFKTEKDQCIIKTEKMTLVFKRNAKKVLGKILPNKDYEWLHKIDKRKK